MLSYVGTSGFSYAPWKGAFYPAKLRPAEMLAFYASHFRAVEINNTFRKLPERSAVEQWAREVPNDFRFALKMPQQVTHFGRLEKKTYPIVDEFFALYDVLGKKAGPVLVQLPHNMKKELVRVRALVEHVAGRAPLAFELGHHTFRDEETYAMLRELGSAIVAIDDPDKAQSLLPAPHPGGFIYARRRLDRYGPKAHAAFAEAVRGASGAKSAWVFFKHEDSARGPRFAKQLTAALTR